MSNPIAWEDSLGDLIAPGDIVADKYRVERILGHGGMGVLVQAWHLHFVERVAIKFLLPEMGANQEAVGRFEREARAAFKIKSEHVARVIDVDRLESGAPYMVMEYLEGTDLGVTLSGGQPLPTSEAVDYLLQVCEAVAEAHALGIVHRDLKPENLFLTRRTDGTPCIKVLDFGLSKLARTVPLERERALTGTEQVMGTPQYMSPEQWMSARDVGAATDIWALGVILYELLTGRQPFHKEQLAQLCTMVLSAEPEAASSFRPDLPAALEQVIQRCLRKTPEERFSNVAQMALQLFPFGPSRGKQSARRIAGVLKRAGIETDELIPPSTRMPRAVALSQQPSIEDLAETRVMSNEEHARLDAPPAGPDPVVMVPHQPPQRAVTSQGWQQEPQPTSSRQLRTVFIAAAVTLLLLGAVSSVIVFGSRRAATSETGGAASAPMAGSAKTNTASSNSSRAMPDEAVDDGGSTAVGSSEPGSSDAGRARGARPGGSVISTTTRTDPGSRGGKPVIGSTTAAPVRPTKTKDIFHDR